MAQHTQNGPTPYAPASNSPTSYSDEETRVMLAQAQALLARSDRIMHRYQTDYARLTAELEKRLTLLAIRDAKIAQLQADLAHARISLAPAPAVNPPPTAAQEAAQAENQRLTAALLAAQGELYQLQQSWPVRLAQIYWAGRQQVKAWLGRVRP